MTRPVYNSKQYRDSRAQVKDLPCHYCGKPPPSTAHHLRSVALHGDGVDSSLNNIVPACQSCQNRIAAWERRALRRTAIPGVARARRQQQQHQRNKRA